MNNIVKTIAGCVIAGAAGAAGHSLWNNVLEEKTIELTKKIKNKKKNPHEHKVIIVKFRNA